MEVPVIARSTTRCLPSGGRDDCLVIGVIIDRDQYGFMRAAIGGILDDACGDPVWSDEGERRKRCLHGPTVVFRYRRIMTSDFVPEYK